MLEKKIKFVILVQHWLSTKGGIATMFYSFVEYLKEKEAFEVFVVTPDPEVHPFKYHGVINVAGRYNKVILFFTTLLELLKISPHVVHCVEHGYMLLACVIYKFFKPSAKIIFSFHTDIGDKKEHYWQNYLLGWLVNKSDCVLSVSQYLSKWAIEHRKLNIKKVIKILPTPVVAKTVEKVQLEEFERNFNLKGCYPILSTIGVFEWEWKVAGVKLLIESFRQLDLANGKLIIVGDGKYNKDLKKFVSLIELEDKVIFTGYLDNPALVLQISTIYCHLALREGLGIAILEAMAAGKPVIAVNRGGIPEIITNRINGLLVEPSVKKVVQSISLLLNNDNFRIKIAQNAKITVENEHNLEKVGRQYVEIVNNICNSIKEKMHNGN